MHSLLAICKRRVGSKPSCHSAHWLPRTLSLVNICSVVEEYCMFFPSSEPSSCSFQPSDDCLEARLRRSHHTRASACTVVMVLDSRDVCKHKCQFACSGLMGKVKWFTDGAQFNTNHEMLIWLWSSTMASTSWCTKFVFAAIPMRLLPTKTLRAAVANLFGHNYGTQEMSDGWEDRQAFTGHAGKLVVLVVLGNYCRLEQTG